MIMCDLNAYLHIFMHDFRKSIFIDDSGSRIEKMLRVFREFSDFYQIAQDNTSECREYRVIVHVSSRMHVARLQVLFIRELPHRLGKRMRITSEADERPTRTHFSKKGSRGTKRVLPIEPLWMFGNENRPVSNEQTKGSPFIEHRTIRNFSVPLMQKISSVTAKCSTPSSFTMIELSSDRLLRDESAVVSLT